MKFFRTLKQVIALWQLPRDERRVVFYSEGRAYWIHLAGLLKAYLDITDQPVVYLTSSDDDPGLEFHHDKLRHIVIDEGGFRNWVFENIQADLMIMTMPDIHNYQVKRSRHGTHYAYVQHSLVSFHMVYRTGAFDHYDTILCAGPHHLPETRALEKQRKSRTKTLFEHGYGRLDDIMNSRHEFQYQPSDPAHILLAPSWGPDSILEVCGTDIIRHILEHGYQLTVRPHPQTFKLSSALIERIRREFSGHPQFSLDEDTATQGSLQLSDMMICDWSGAALDYAFGLEKPVLFVDVPRKVNNPEYTDIDIEPFESGIREQIGKVISPDDIDQIGPMIESLLEDDVSERQSRLAAMRDQHVFNPGRSDTAGASYLLDLARRLRNEEPAP